MRFGSLICFSELNLRIELPSSPIRTFRARDATSEIFWSSEEKLKTFEVGLLSNPETGIAFLRLAISICAPRAKVSLAQTIASISGWRDNRRTVEARALAIVSSPHSE